MSQLNAVSCPKCGNHLIVGEIILWTQLDAITGKSTEVRYQEVACLGSGCDYSGKYVPWREASSQPPAPRPLTSPPPRSNTALILDAQRMVLASSESCGVAVYRAQSFEHAEYIVWCVGIVLKRVRTAQREVVAMLAGVRDARESYRYHHVWDRMAWDEFYAGVAETTTQPQNELNS